VQLAFSEVTFTENKVMIRWETADEADLIGFYIYREPNGSEDQERERLTKDLLIAEKSGKSSGFAYTYEDVGVEAGTEYRYFIGFVDPSGLEVQSPLGSVITQRTVNEWFIYLPFIVDN